ncbi:hypothetical protein [Poriferisphaera sp. WC338]|uniref:hypothetical protein n=1 Tax=Poriferisphaera sp. WC338 TaxID=3425129 RepID=UPI003D8161EB
MKSRSINIALASLLSLSLILLVGYQSYAQDNEMKDNGRMMHDMDKDGNMMHGMDNDKMMRKDGMMGKGMMGKGMMMHKGMGMNPDMWMAFKKLALYNRWFDLVEQYTDVVDDADSAGIAAIMAAGHVLEDQPDKYMAFLMKAMPNASSGAVKRALTLEMAKINLRPDSEATHEKGLDQLIDIIQNK